MTDHGCVDTLPCPTDEKEKEGEMETEEEEDGDTMNLACVFATQDLEYMLVVTPDTISYTTTLVCPHQLNVDYIVDLFEHPLNGTLPPDSDIVDYCHLHYANCEGVHVLHRDGLLGEVDFPWAECDSHLETLLETLRATPFMRDIRVATRSYMDARLRCRTNFKIDVARLCSDGRMGRVEESSQSHVRFVDPFDCSGVTVECSDTGDVAVTVSDHENIEDVAFTKAVCTLLINTLAAYVTEGTLMVIQQPDET
jgi:hypothetical protein